jgi:hypothetical protein
MLASEGFRTSDGTILCSLKSECEVDLGYNVMKVTEYFVSL